MSTAIADDGTRIGYSAFPSTGGARRLALLHSLGMDRRFWMPVIRILADEASVVVLDSRGHGESGSAPDEYTASLLAADVRAVFDQIGWESAIVAGASMGGCVTLQFASDYPSRIEAIGLF